MKRLRPRQQVVRSRHQDHPASAAEHAKPPTRIEHVVWLSFECEPDEQFMARYPDARGPDGRRWEADVVLGFDGSAQ